MFREIADIVSAFSETPAEDIRPDSDLIRELNIGSYEMLELTFALEAAYDILVSESSIKYFVTVSDLERYVERAVASKQF